MASENETVAEVREDVHEYLTSIGPGEYPDETQFEEFADRFVAAATQPVTNCNHLGNAARMREALVKADAAFRRISQSAWFIDANFSETKELMDAGNAITSALSAPSRNCDMFSNARDALEAFEKETGETMIEFIRWLFSEARGGAK